MWSHRESNSDLIFRRDLFYPLNYETFIAFAVKQRAHYHPLAGNRRGVPLQLRAAKVQYFVETAELVYYELGK